MKGYIAITGGLGFIGTNLVQALTDDMGYRVKILDDYSNISGDLHATHSVDIIEGDIRDKGKIRELLQGADIVIHLAAQTRVIESVENPELSFQINVTGTLNILEVMRETGVKRIICASTGGAILGEVPPPISEEMVAKPSSPYGASKLAMEAYCSAYARSYGISATNLRFSNIYGPHCKHKSSVVAAFLKSILAQEDIIVYGDGSQTRDYLFVSDLVDGVCNAIDASVTGVYQLGAGRPTTINELISTIREVTNSNFETSYLGFRSGEVLHTYCDIGKARQEIAFRPKTTLSDGIEETWKWLQKSV